MHKIIWTFFP